MSGDGSGERGLGGVGVFGSVVLHGDGIVGGSVGGRGGSCGRSSIVGRSSSFGRRSIVGRSSSFGRSSIVGSGIGGIDGGFAGRFEIFECLLEKCSRVLVRAETFHVGCNVGPEVSDVGILDLLLCDEEVLVLLFEETVS